MSNFIYQDMNHPARVQALKKLAFAKVHQSFTRTLSEAEISAENSAYVRDAMMVTQLEDDLKIHNAKVKAKIKEIKTTQIGRLEEIGTGKRKANEMTYGIRDQVKGKMCFYDQYGEMVMQRDLLEAEKQNVLFLGDHGETIPDSEEAMAAKNVLDAFPVKPEFTDAEEVHDEEQEEYEPEVNEEAPDESDLESPEEDEADKVEEDLEEKAPEDPDEDWRPDDLKEQSAKAESAGKEKKPRKPRKPKPGKEEDPF